MMNSEELQEQCYALRAYDPEFLAAFSVSRILAMGCGRNKMFNQTALTANC